MFKTLPDQCIPVKVKTKQLKEHKAMFFPAATLPPTRGFRPAEFRFLNNGQRIDDVTHWQAVKG